MLIIGLDTTSRSGSVSIIKENYIIGECLLNTGPRHSENIVSSLNWLIKTLDIEKSKIDAIAVSRGPGSFTSLRVGMTIAKSLAYTLKLKIIGVSSLKVLAMNIADTDKNVCALLDAKRDEVYSAVYRYNNDRLYEIRHEKIQNSDELIKEIDDPTIFVGEGAEVYKDRLAEIPGSEVAAEKFNIIRSSNCAFLGQELLLEGNSGDVMTLVPNYLRKTDAEIKMKT